MTFSETGNHVTLQGCKVHSNLKCHSTPCVGPGHFVYLNAMPSRPSHTQTTEEDQMRTTQERYKDNRKNVKGGTTARVAAVLLALMLVSLPVEMFGQAAAAPAQNPPATGRKKRVAVMDFDYATVHGGVAAIFGQDIDVGKGIADLLVTRLVKDGTYSVIERKALDKILAEQNFSNSDRANPASAAKLGKMLGVDAIIVGSITQFGNDTKNTNLGGAAGGLIGHGLGGFGHKKSKAIVALTA